MTDTVCIKDLFEGLMENLNREESAAVEYLMDNQDMSEEEIVQLIKEGALLEVAWENFIFEESIPAQYLKEIGYDFYDAIERYEDVHVTDDIQDYAEQLFLDCYHVPEELENFIDWEKVARELSYDMYEIEGGVFITNHYDF